MNGMGMKTKIFAAAAMLAVFMAAAAQSNDADSLAQQTVEHRSALTAQRDDVFSNPAMQGLRFRTSLNTLSAGFSHTAATSPVRLEYGDGHNLGFGHIDAYLKKGKATLWGAADYRNGKTRNIQYNESSDFDIVAPYAIADTVGGSSKRERYHFKGGFSYPIGRFTIGAEGEYSALLEYRTRDPRPKNLSGDLRGKLGVACLLDRQNILGIALTARRYKQTNEVEIYNEVSMPVIYHLTGLGTDYYRFRGDQTETYYKGWSWGSMATFARRDGNGLFAQAGFDHFELEKIISSLNQLPMVEATTNSLNATLGLSRHDATNSGYGLSAFATWKQRKGTENIFGTAQDNIYPNIAEAQQYQLTTWNAGVRGVWQQTFETCGYAVGLTAAYANHDEQYADPQRLMKASAFTATLTLNAHATVGRILLTGDATAGYEWATDSSLSLPQTVNSTAMLKPANHYYNYLSNNRWRSNLTVEAAYNTGKRFQPFIALNYQYTHYAVSAHSQEINITTGVRF